MLELDDRIINNAHPYDCFSNAEEVSQYSKGWFTNILEDFTNLDNHTVYFRELTGIKNSVYPFETKEGYFKFFLPECMVKEHKKTLRAYNSVKELPFTVGDTLFIKDKESQEFEKCTCSSISYRKNDSVSLISLGTTTYSVQELLEDYEWRFTETGDWKPFGVEE